MIAVERHSGRPIGVVSTLDVARPLWRIGLARRPIAMSTIGRKPTSPDPGIGDYARARDVLPDDYQPLLDPRETMEALYAREAPDRGRALRGAEPDDGAGAADRRPRERRQRLPRPRRLAHAGRVPHLERPRPPPDRRRGRPGGDEVEADGAARSSAWARARACSPTCARCARTTSSTTTTAPTSTSGTGRRRSRPSTATLDYLTETVRAIWARAQGGRGVTSASATPRSPTRATRRCPTS